MCGDDTERESVRRRRTRAKIGIRPQDRRARTRVDRLHHADQPFRHHQWRKRPHSCRAAGREQNRVFITFRCRMHYFGRDESPLQPLPKPEQRTQTIIFRAQRLRRLRSQCERIHRFHESSMIADRLSTAFRPRLRSHQWRSDTRTQDTLHQSAHTGWQDQRTESRHQCHAEQRHIGARSRARRPRH